MNGQARQAEWHEQWTLFQDGERFLFEEWIAPVTMEAFRGRRVLECGCGGGQHTAWLASVASEVTAVDLNTTDIARARTAGLTNVRFVEADIATMDLHDRFDVVVCVGVIHHTDDPDRTFESLFRHCRPEGLLVVWTYSAEGNEMVRWGVEPARKLVFRWMPRAMLRGVSHAVTALLYPIVYSVYALPGTGRLPYHAYFRNWRRLGFRRNSLNVFDKLNAPQTRFTTLEKCRQWFGPDRFEPASISIRRYCGVSYALSGIKRSNEQ